jgi:hypothetical protein
MNRLSIRRRVFGPLTVGVIVLTAAVAVFWGFQSRHLEPRVSARIHSVEKSLAAILDGDAKSFRMAIDLLDEDVELSEACLALAAALVEPLHQETQRCLRFIPELQTQPFV